MNNTTLWVFISVLIVGLLVVGAMNMGYLSSDGSMKSMNGSTSYSPLQQRQQFGGSISKKMVLSSMSTKHIGILLIGIFVGYITSKFI